jgi:predicted regulator of Ras-like GTPase activity (Roadblock/LC7/MglB family)
MGKLDDLLQNVVQDVDGALGCAVVDLENGLLLSVAHNVPYFTSSYLEAVAAAAVDMIRGRNVRAVESLLSSQRGQPVKHMIQEIQMSTEKTYHFMAVVPDKPNSLVVLITSRNTNLGMGWSAVRTNLPAIAELCPS